MTHPSASLKILDKVASFSFLSSRVCRQTVRAVVGLNFESHRELGFFVSNNQVKLGAASRQVSGTLIGPQISEMLIAIGLSGSVS